MRVVVATLSHAVRLPRVDVGRILQVARSVDRIFVEAIRGIHHARRPRGVPVALRIGRTTDASLVDGAVRRTAGGKVRVEDPVLPVEAERVRNLRRSTTVPGDAESAFTRA